MAGEQGQPQHARWWRDLFRTAALLTAIVLALLDVSWAVVLAGAILIIVVIELLLNAPGGGRGFGRWNDRTRVRRGHG